MSDILIVEDEIVTAMDLEGCLSTLGHHVVGTAASGGEAIALASSRHPDLVLMDVLLRGDVDGIAAARTIGAELGTPVVFMSAIDSEEIVQRAMAANPYGYIVKPYREIQLKVTIETALNSARLKRQAERHEQQLRRTQATVDHAPIGILWFDADATVIYANRRAQAMLGYTEQEINGMASQALEVPNCRSEVQTGKDHAETTFETVVQRGDGTTLPVSVYGYSLHTMGTHVIVCHIDDITARQQAEAALRHSEAMTRAVMNAAQDCIFCKDRDLRYTFVNPAMERLLACPAREILGKTAAEVFGAEAARVIDPVDAPVLRGETVNAVRKLAIGEQIRTFHTVQTPIRDANGIVGLCGIVREVTPQATPVPPAGNGERTRD